jgi:hypothetical protein
VLIESGAVGMCMLESDQYEYARTNTRMGG